jgi:hypothetical protein
VSCRATVECIFGWGKQHGTMPQGPNIVAQPAEITSSLRELVAARQTQPALLHFKEVLAKLRIRLEPGLIFAMFCEQTALACLAASAHPIGSGRRNSRQTDDPARDALENWRSRAMAFLHSFAVGDFLDLSTGNASASVTCSDRLPTPRST